MPNILTNATNQQLEKAVALNHTELFCLNALAAGGDVWKADGITWTHCKQSGESMIAFPNLSEDRVASQLDEIMQYYLHQPPRGVGCWSLHPTQPADLGIRLLARGFQPGWRPNWMCLDLNEMETNHSLPPGLEVIPDNTTSITNVKDLPYADTDITVYVNQKDKNLSRAQRFIAKLDGEIVAHSAVLLSSGPLGVGGLYHVGVVPAVRNKGIGKAVVIAACLHAKEQGYQYVTLNGTGQRMYRQCGFKKIGDGWTWWLKIDRLLAHPPTTNEVLFLEAIGHGDIASLDKLSGLFNKEFYHKPITNGMTLIEFAIHCEQHPAAEWLVAQGAPIRLLEAYDLGWKDRALQLIKEDPRLVNKTYGDWQITLLHIAAERNDIDLARLALAGKPDLHITDKMFNSTPLGWAEYFGRTQIIKLLKF